MSDKNADEWPERPNIFPELMTPVEAAMFLRLDETGHNPESASRTLNYWRDRGELRATKYARHVWYLRNELEKFLGNKTEEGVCDNMSIIFRRKHLCFLTLPDKMPPCRSLLVAAYPGWKGGYQWQ